MSTDKAAAKAGAAKALRVNEKKWSKPLMDAGWNILLHLAVYWWTADSKPRPAKKTIAEAVGVDPRTVQRRIAALEAAKLIRREERRIKGIGSRPNIYHFDGLIEAALPYAHEKLAERAEREAAKKAAVARKGKLKLRVVKSDDNDE